MLTMKCRNITFLRSLNMCLDAHKNTIYMYLNMYDNIITVKYITFHLFFLFRHCESVKSWPMFTKNEAPNQLSI